MPRMNALSDFFREQAAAHRATAHERTDDPRPERSADERGIVDIEAGALGVGRRPRIF